MARLENWHVAQCWHVEQCWPAPYQAPECGGIALLGEVYMHPNCYEGQYVRTTAVCFKEVVEGEELVVTASGTRYALGTPAEKYEEQFPGAKARLFKVLKEKM